MRKFLSVALSLLLLLVLCMSSSHSESNLLASESHVSVIKAELASSTSPICDEGQTSHPCHFGHACHFAALIPLNSNFALSEQATSLGAGRSASYKNPTLNKLIKPPIS